MLKKNFELLNGLRQPSLWITLGYLEILQSYRRSVIGPWWITLALAIQSFAMTVVFGAVFGMPNKEYAGYVVTGLIAWSWINSIITESGGVYLVGARYIKETNISKEVLIYASAFRLLIISLHNCALLLIVIGLGVIEPSLYHLLVPLLLIVFFFLTIPISALLGTACARYRDITRILNSLVIVIMLITPIFWLPNALNGKRQFIIEYNPIYYLVEFLRQPMLGNFNPLVFLGVILSIIPIWLCAEYINNKYSKEVVFWVD